ncbi:hypothetical protein AMECASPLE_016273 [Ameca splendens]|uniref:Uncharacterized protein n=1 Tax=Ameca splendens TaxID=208324 RepID=A0ABV0Y214_9TELE
MLGLDRLNIIWNYSKNTDHSNRFYYRWYIWLILRIWGDLCLSCCPSEMNYANEEKAHLHNFCEEKTSIIVDDPLSQLDKPSSNVNIMFFDFSIKHNSTSFALSETPEDSDGALNNHLDQRLPAIIAQN